MVLAHTWFNDFASDWINMFHMPLFFFFSGYCFKNKYLSTPFDYFKKKVNGIYIPFVKWSLIFLIFHNVLFHLNIYNGSYGYLGKVSHLYSIKEFGMKLIHIVTALRDNEQLLGGYWFLNTLFWTVLVGFVIIRFFQIEKLSNFIATIIVLFISTAAIMYFKVRLPYFYIGSRESLALTFYITGYYLKSRNSFESFADKTSWLLPASIIIVTIGTVFSKANMASSNPSRVVPYFIIAVAGTIGVYSLSKYINSRTRVLKNILIIVGENTLTILTWHFLCFKLISLLIILVHGLPIQRLAEFPVIEEYSQYYFVLYLLVGVGIPVLMSRNRFLR